MKMIEVKSYRDLAVWQKSMDLVVRCYQLISQFPKTEIYLLIVERLEYIKQEELKRLKPLPLAQCSKLYFPTIFRSPYLLSPISYLLPLSNILRSN